MQGLGKTKTFLKPLNNTAILFATLIFLLLIQSCKDKTPTDSQEATRDNGYKGTLSVVVDDGLEPVMQQQKQVFEYQNDSVQLNIAYKGEAEMLSDFKTKKATVLVLARELDEKEKENLKSADTIYVREVKIAYDAVAMIGNLQFDDNKLDITTLKKYFDPNNASAEGPRMVFNNQNSSIVKHVLNYLGYKYKVSPNVYALKSTEEVLDYVEKNKNAIGFVPFNFLSETDDERVKQIYKRIKVLSLRVKNEKGQEIQVSANQSDIATGDYPLKRTINAVINFTYSDNLEWLFVNFLFREKGAKIFLRDGLIPAKRTEREINVNTEGLNAVNQ